MMLGIKKGEDKRDKWKFTHSVPTSKTAKNFFSSVTLLQIQNIHTVPYLIYKYIR